MVDVEDVVIISLILGLIGAIFLIGYLDGVNKDLVEAYNNRTCPTCNNSDMKFVQEAFDLMGKFCYDDLALCQEQLRVCIPGELTATVNRE